jgi:hypothetical protein
MTKFPLWYISNHSMDKIYNRIFWFFHVLKTTQFFIFWSI